MKIREQQILNPKKLRAARIWSRISGSFKPSANINLPIDKSTIKNILVQEHQCIGDVLMLEPALTAIRNAFPDATVDLICVRSVKELADSAALTDNIFGFPDELPVHKHYDLAFDFHGDIRRLAMLKKYKTDLRAGFSFSGGARWLTHVTDYPYEDHQIERPLVLLEMLGIPVQRKIPQLCGFEKDVKYRNLILLHPGANHEARRWPQEHWDVLTDLLLENGRELLWITPPGEKPSSRIESFEGDLVALAKLAASSRLLVGCDSMSVHLAAAVGTPALAIFGSQDPELTKPYGPNGHFILPEKECTHRKRDWRLCRECMKAVSPENVVQKVNSIISF